MFVTLSPEFFALWSVTQGVPGGKVSILRGRNIGRSKQKICTCVLFRTVSEIKKEILRTVSNTDIYCSSDKVGTVYLV
jgi:hypothetical protein